MTPDPTAIATRLSKAQRSILLQAPTGGNWFPMCWEGWRGLFWSLQRLGLAYAREPGLQTLSPLGLAVRAILESGEE